MPTKPIDPGESPAAFFASELRRLREASGYSQNDLGKKLGYSEQAVGMVELTRRTPTEEFAKGCDRAFGTDGAFARLWPLVKRASVQRWFQEYVELETRAMSIHSWDPQNVPGLFQTEAYARELIAAYRGNDTDALVAARMARQETAFVPGGPQIWAVIDEAVLRRPIGPQAVWLNQLARLVELGSSPHCVLQVLPFATGAHACSDGAVILLGFDDGPDIAFADGPGQGTVVERSEEVRGFRLRYDLVRAQALSPEASLGLIEGMIKEQK
ncbi:helix-turn-helix transcriptional regulator [Actinospica sp. MGRD01-02]|uniref:Helix-turn-helix transcriptional regulator n=1 Tax=Actinospica acidithermotolerans TaxID=2828514 RepID=A0A941E3X0_9ACTN|nr:helix-turn-helix transcriptional regulator [Actinospica acidithermotolerans]MBR7824691.1 helix-turn-helix transcriptional regulator [Actinospica acidithermotolerans]